MKNARSNVLRLFAVTLALSCSPLRAEKVDDTKYNIPEIIKTYGKGVDSNWVGLQIPKAPLIIKSEPLEMDFDLTFMSSFKEAYVVVRCKTPCKIDIPSFAGIAIKTYNPSGYVLKSKPETPKWKQGLLRNYMKPENIVYSWIPE
jgi:hypothetical protein